MHIQIDFETFSLKPNAVLLQLAAVAFDANTREVISTLHVHIDPRVQPGRDISADTVIWWMGQGEAARASLTNATRMADRIESDTFENLSEVEQDHVYEQAGMLIPNAAQAFIAWFNGVTDPEVQSRHGELEGVWSLGGIDHVWLDSLMEYTGLKNPVHYALQRDFRTLRALFPEVQAPEFKGTPHNALDDALYQTEHMLNILQHIQGTRAPE